MEHLIHIVICGIGKFYKYLCYEYLMYAVNMECCTIDELLMYLLNVSKMLI